MQVRTAAHKLVGRALLKEALEAEGELSPLKWLECAAHFGAANDTKTVASMVLRGLSAVNESWTAEKSWFVSHLLAIALPLGLEPYFEIVVRTERIRSLGLLGRDYRPDMDILVGLCNSATPQAAVAALNAVLNFVGAPGIHMSIEQRCRLLRVGLRFDLDFQGNEAALLYLVAGDVRTPEDVIELGRLLKDLPPRLASRVFARSSAELLVMAFEKFWTATADEPPTDRRWDQVLECVDTLAALGVELGQSILEGIAERVRCIIRAEYLGDVELGIRDALAWCSTCEDLVANYLVGTCAVREYAFANQPNEALELLDRLGEAPPSLGREEYLTLVAVARSVAKFKPARAIELFSHAVLLADQTDLVTGHEKFRALAELALVTWKFKGIRAAWPLVDEAAEVLLGLDTQKASTQSDAVLFGHLLAYLSSLAKTGAPPQATSGGDHFAEPQIGMFGSTNEVAAALFAPNNRIAYTLLLHDYGVACEDFAAASKWRMRGTELAQPNGSQLVASMLELSRGVDLVSRGEFAEGLQSFYRSIRSISAWRLTETQDQPFDLSRTIDVEEALRGRPAESRSCLETVATIFRLTSALVVARALSQGGDVSALAEDLLTACRSTIQQLSDHLASFGSLVYAAAVAVDPAEALLERGNRFKGYDDVIVACANIFASAAPSTSNELALTLQIATVAFVKNHLLAVGSGGALLNDLLSTCWALRLPSAPPVVSTVDSEQYLHLIRQFIEQ